MAPISRLDSHHHFWRYVPSEYEWIDESKTLIRRDFLPEDFKRELDEAGVSSAISVQARQTLAETDALLGFAEKHEFIKGVVGWVPLIDPKVETSLAHAASNPKLRAVRHVLETEPDPNYMLRPDFNAGIRLLARFDLVYDILIFERHLPQTIQFVDKHPNQIFILDHLAKPRVRDGEIAPWNQNIRELAKRPNVYCKLSGLVTEADYIAWTPDQLKPYLDTVLDAFGPERLMFGSDWPVCLVAVSYKRWVSVLDDFTAALSATEQQQIWSGTAEKAYQLT